MDLFNYIILYAPVIFAVFSEIGIVAAIICKVNSYFKKAESAVDELKESAEYKDLKNQMKTVLAENYELKKKINVVLEKMTKVKVHDEDN